MKGNMNIYFNRRNKPSQEIINGIAEHIDNDIDCLLNDEPLSMNGREIPEFDKYGVYQNLIDKINKKRNLAFWPLLGRACAVALLIFNIGYFGYVLSDRSIPEYQEIFAAKGEKLIVLLPDGSRVRLNSDSKLVYPEQFTGDERGVSLIGEAYFEVKKNQKNPFIVNADGMKIKVTGTSFNVSAYPSDDVITATLDDGRILIGSEDPEAVMYEMQPGQTAVYDKKSASCDIRTDEFYKDASGWTENRLVFRNTPLEDVLEILSRQFDVRFDIRADRITKFTYNFVCKANDIGNIMHTMETITPIKFNKVSEDVYEINTNK